MCPTKICVALAILAVTAGIMLTVTNAHAASPSLAVGPQYDTTHVYVAPEEFDRFSDALVATFGGTKSQAAVINITPTPSETMWQAVFTPAGTFSVFGFKTPIPYPFGIERTGYLVSDFDAAIDSAKANHADIVVAPFPDPIGRDAIIAWPGGVYMQLYIGIGRRLTTPVCKLFRKIGFTYRRIVPTTLSVTSELLRRRKWFRTTQRRPVSKSEGRTMYTAAYGWIRRSEKSPC